MELYEVLYTDNISNCENGDLVSYPATDEDGNEYTEQLRIIDVDVDDVITVRGYSEVTNLDTVVFFENDDVVEVLGG